MSGGIIQLIAVGQQDTHVVGNPEISFFRSSYRRHTNFAQYVDRQVIQGNPHEGGMSSVRIEKKGDLLNYMFITALQNGVVQSFTNWTQVINKIELFIGGQLVDTQDSVFCEQIAIDSLSQRYTQGSAASLHNGLDTSSDFYPLRFFFCENWQSSIPLLALEHHDVELRIYWGTNVSYDFEIAANFIVLDDPERQDIRSQDNIDMLIFQIQKNIPSNEKIMDLSFNHPVKFLASSNAVVGGSNPLASTSNRVKFEINGLDITDFKQSSPYFTTIPAYYHTQYSRGNKTYMFIYPFCLDTTKLQPTGTLNFSRVTTFRIHSEEVLTQPVYAVNYNILRIQNGMGGVVYAN